MPAMACRRGLTGTRAERHSLEKTMSSREYTGGTPTFYPDVSAFYRGETIPDKTYQTASLHEES